MNEHTYETDDGTKRRRRRLKIRAGVFCMLFMFLASPLIGFAAEGNKPAAPNETILYKNGNWETAHWGDEGRMAYRYSGSSEVSGSASEEAFEISFAIDSPTLVRSVITVHSNEQDGSITTLKSVIDGESSFLDPTWPTTNGEVAITDEEGTVYGPFSCAIGSPAVVNGEVQPSVLWVADIGELELEPGQYTVMGSLPETLIINDETGGQPAILVKGVNADKWNEYIDNTGLARSFQGSYLVEVQDEFGNMAAEPVVFGMIDNGDSLKIVGMVADMPVDQSINIISRSEDLIEAGGSVSLLPDQGLFDLSINTAIRLENGEWAFSGDWTLSQSMGGEQQTSRSTFQGKMIGRDLPGFFFPKPAAGLGSLGNIPGPANETQAAAGVIAPGLLALLASVFAGGGKTSGGAGGTTMLIQPTGPVAPNGGDMPGDSMHAGINNGQAFNPIPAVDHNVVTHSVPTGFDKSALTSVNAEVASPLTPQGHAVNTASFAQGIHAASAVNPIIGLADKEGFMRIVNEGMHKSGQSSLGSTVVNENLLGMLAESDAKRRLIGRLGGMLKNSCEAGSTDALGEAKSRISGLMDDLLKGKKNFVQANSDAQQIQNMLGGQSASGANTISESIQKAMGQVVDPSRGNVLNGVSIQVANDVASGGLADLGFSGGDMLKNVAKSFDADDVLSGTMTQMSALQFVSDESDQLTRQGLDILSPLFKPRTNLPEDLIKTAQNRAFSI